MKKLLLILYSVSLFIYTLTVSLLSYSEGSLTIGLMSHYFAIVFCCMGLLGMAYQIPLFFPQLWRTASFSLPIIAGSLVAYAYLHQQSFTETSISLWMSIPLAIIALPISLCLYFYSDKNLCLWITSKRNLDALLLDSILYDHKKIAITSEKHGQGPIKLSIEKIRDDLYSVYMICKEDNRDVAFSNQFFSASSVSRFISRHAGIEVKDIERKYF